MRTAGDALREGLRPIVLVPRDRVVKAGRRQDVHVAVAVDVDRECGVGAVSERRDDALGRGDARAGERGLIRSHCKKQWEETREAHLDEDGCPTGWPELVGREPMCIKPFIFFLPPP